MDAGLSWSYPTAAEALAWCALAALALLGLIVGGFALLWRAERDGGRPASHERHGLHELGLLGLWRLQQNLRRLPPTGARPGQLDVSSSALDAVPPSELTVAGAGLDSGRSRATKT